MERAHAEQLQNNETGIVTNSETNTNMSTEEVKWLQVSDQLETADCQKD